MFLDQKQWPQGEFLSMRVGHMYTHTNTRDAQVCVPDSDMN